jgi:hypothetical protein
MAAIQGGLPSHQKDIHNVFQLKCHSVSSLSFLE